MAAPSPVVPVDAAPPVEIDAAPEAETLDVTIRTEPPGADIQVDGVDKGPSPVALRLPYRCTLRPVAFASWSAGSLVQR